jgi:hypothetical protein
MGTSSRRWRSVDSFKPTVMIEIGMIASGELRRRRGAQPVRQYDMILYGSNMVITTHLPDYSSIDAG